MSVHMYAALKSQKHTREYGLMGDPFISRYSSAKTFGPLSIARPDPSNMRPSISSDTPSLRLSPVNSTFDYSSLATAFGLKILFSCLFHIYARSTLENLYDSTVSYGKIISLRTSCYILLRFTSCLEDLSGPFCAIWQRQGDNFIVSWEFDLHHISVLRDEPSVYTHSRG